MMSVNYIQRKCKEGSNFTKLQDKINHLMYMDYITPFVKNGNEHEAVIQKLESLVKV